MDMDTPPPSYSQLFSLTNNNSPSPPPPYYFHSFSKQNFDERQNPLVQTDEHGCDYYEANNGLEYEDPVDEQHYGVCESSNGGNESQIQIRQWIQNNNNTLHPARRDHSYLRISQNGEQVEAFETSRVDLDFGQGDAGHPCHEGDATTPSSTCTAQTSISNTQSMSLFGQDNFRRNIKLYSTCYKCFTLVLLIIIILAPSKPHLNMWIFIIATIILVFVMIAIRNVPKPPVPLVIT